MLASAQDDSDDLDRGPNDRSGGAAERNRERFCALSRLARPVDDLIRFVAGPDGAVVPDLKRKLPGRGLWITASRDAVDEAVKRKVFARGFKRDVHAGSDLAQVTGDLLARAALDALAIAGKAGDVPAGFGKVEAALMRDRVVALLHASEAARDGVRKLGNVLATRPDAEQISTISQFSSSQLDLALGRSNVIHAALLAGPSSNTFLARFRRLERFRTGSIAGEGVQTHASN